MADQVTITSPDDWHVHLRDEQMLQRVVTDTARTFRRAIVMPNLRPPVTHRCCSEGLSGAHSGGLPIGDGFHAVDDGVPHR